MRRSLGTLVLIGAVLCFSAAAGAATRDLSISGVQAIRRTDGEGRVLFRVPELTALSGQFVTSASLEIPLRRGVAVERDVDVYLFALSQAWSDGAATWDSPWRIPGGEWPVDDYGVAHIRSGRQGAVLHFDVSTLVRAIVDGEAPPHGFILTAGPAEGVGRFLPGDLSALGDLAGATLHVSYHSAKRRPDRS